MRLYVVYLLSLLVLNNNVSAQEHNSAVELNSGVDTTQPIYKNIFDLWSRYIRIAAINPDTALLDRYWAPAELTKYKSVDLISHEVFFTQPFYSYPTRKLVLSITKQKDSCYIIKTECYFKNEKDQINVLAIINVGVCIMDGQYKFVNYLSLATENWKNRTIGDIHFFYPEHHLFDFEQASRSSAFLDSMYRTFDLPKRQVMYVMGNSCDMVKQVRGFDYLAGMGGDRKICGVFDKKDFIAYSGGLGEYYPHELVHVINTYFPNSCDLFLTGLSALWGGHFGKPIIYHVRRVIAYLDSNHIRAIDPLKFTTMDEYTAPTYVTGGLLCKKILEKGGVPLLKKAMSYGTGSEDFYRAIDDLLGIDKKHLPRYIVTELHKWAQRG